MNANKIVIKKKNPQNCGCERVHTRMTSKIKWQNLLGPIYKLPDKTLQEIFHMTSKGSREAILTPHQSFSNGYDIDLY